jgi:hypothetical protein
LKSQILHGPLSHKTEAEVACESITTAKKNNGRKRQRQKSEKK